MSSGKDSNDEPPKLGVWIWTLGLMFGVIAILWLSDVANVVFSLFKAR
jgi:hypothetical protein